MNLETRSPLFLCLVFILTAIPFFIAYRIVSHTSPPLSFELPSVFSGHSLDAVQAPRQLASVEGAGSGLVGWWKFDEGSGTTAGDSSGSGNVGTLIGTNLPLWTATAKVGPGALVFDGTDNVSMGNPASLNFGTGSFSYGLWVFATANAGSWDEPWNKGGASTSSPGYDIELGNGLWTANVSDQTSVRQAVIAQAPLMNQWVQIYVVADRSSNQLRTYVNGQPVGGTGVASLAGLGSVSGSADALIGGSTYRFVGTIDDVRVYNRALSDAEVAQIYTSAALVSQPSGPYTYYVSPSGNDSNPGTISAPFLTVQHAADLVNAGDTIIIRAGTYNGFHISRIVGTANAPLTIQAYPGEHPVILGNDNGHGFSDEVYSYNSSDGLYYLVPTGYLTVSGLEFTGATSAGALEIAAAQHVTVRNNTFDNNNLDDILIDSSQYVTIDGNLFHDSGSYVPADGRYEGHAIYMTGQHDTITNNVFYNIHANYAVQAAAYNSGSTKCVWCYRIPAGFGYVDDWTIANNTFAASSASTPAVVLWDGGNGGTGGDVSNVRVVNNIFYNNDGGVEFYRDGTGAAMNTGLNVYNNLWLNTPTTTSFIVNQANATYTATANTQADPLFVNPQGHDFHLTSGSPAIDTGIALSQVTTDMDGVTRPQGSAYDIGAYEYSSAGRNPTPTPTPTPTPSTTPTSIPTPDTIAPTVSITTPSNNSTIVGSVSLAATASDNVGGSGVNMVQFKLDGTNLGSALTTPTSGSTYSGTWNTSGVSNGSHTLTAIATDVAGNSAMSNSVTVTINNPLPTPTPTPTPTPIGATPTPTNPPASGGGGGGGGGSGGGGAGQSPSVGTFTPVVPQKPAIATINSGGACTPSQTTITKPLIPALLLTLSLGDKGQNVITLQNYLIQGGFLPAD
ncbi:MAG: right-handed parallel beta-helix repeat-containing protein, partial [Patescibacteria group bacterium]|nr:right-handed parallel beta-helix repeat-containing protein [Patescibacteria group bacterium]